MRRALVLAVLAFGFVVAPARADVYDVTTTVDGGGGVCPDDGIHRCTIRAAMAAAKANGNAIPDLINVPAGTYPLLSSLTTGTTSLNVTLQGAGAATTIIQGSGADRVLSIDGEATYTLAGLTLTGGRERDANGGDLLVGAGALGILDHVRVTDGHAIRGGGVANQGRALGVNASTIDGNVATNDGGGIANTSTGSSLLVNSTVAFNTAAGGAGVSATGTTGATLTNVTLARNTGGGLSMGTGTYTITSSILAANSGSNCAGGKMTDKGANVESGTDCGFAAPGDRQGASAGLADALTTDVGQTPTLPLLPGSPAVDLAGACTGTDQRDVARPQGAACDAGAYELVPAPVLPAPSPTPTPQPAPTPTPIPTPPPAPVFHKQVVVRPVSGKVRVKLAGTNTFIDLASAADIPLGSTLDVKHGKLQLSSVPKAGGTPQTATFFGGIFKVTQPGGTTDLKLNEPLASCTAHAAAAKKAKSRHLWGSGSGAFRTSGQYSAATVRGTEWLVQDSCSGTLTRVKKGLVSVRDNVRRKTIVVRAGHRYLAKPRH
jgi:hypothetical protein